MQTAAVTAFADLVAFDDKRLKGTYVDRKSVGLLCGLIWGEVIDFDHRPGCQATGASTNQAVRVLVQLPHFHWRQGECFNSFPLRFITGVGSRGIDPVPAVGEYSGEALAQGVEGKRAALRAVMAGMLTSPLAVFAGVALVPGAGRVIR